MPQSIQDVKRETIQLPAARRKGRMSLEEALLARRSRRAYGGEPVTLAEAAQLLWAAQGITSPELQRTAPSAGALYPLETYLAATRVEGLAPGIYHYLPERHGLVLERAGDVRKELTAAAMDQDCLRFSACVILFAAVYERMTVKYGERGAGFALREAGHAAQNVCLQAAALGLGTVVMGAFDPVEVRRIAGLPEEQDPVYLMPAGRP